MHFYLSIVGQILKIIIKMEIIDLKFRVESGKKFARIINLTTKRR